MTRSRAGWSALGLVAGLLTLAPAVLFFSSPWPRAPAFVLMSVGSAAAAGFLTARGRRGQALVAAATSQLVVAYTYVVEQPGYELYPWLFERGSRTGSNTIAWAIWVIICVAIGRAGYAWGRGRRAQLARIAGWFLIGIGVVAGGFTLLFFAAAYGYYGVDPGAEALWALTPALPVVPGVVLLTVSSRLQARSDQGGAGRLPSVEPSSFGLILEGHEGSAQSFVRELRQHVGLTADAARAAVSSMPSPLIAQLVRQQAEAMADQLRSVGGLVSVHTTRGSIRR